LRCGFNLHFWKKRVSSQMLKGVALNQLINVAVAEKLSALRTADYFTARAVRADIPKALKVLKRAGVGKPPIKGDELPPRKREQNAKRHDDAGGGWSCAAVRYGPLARIAIRRTWRPPASSSSMRTEAGRRSPSQASLRLEISWVSCCRPHQASNSSAKREVSDVTSAKAGQNKRYCGRP